MNLDLSPEELEELRELIEFSINKITSEIHHASSPQNKIELKAKKEELINILSKIDSKMEQQAA